MLDELINEIEDFQGRNDLTVEQTILLLTRALEYFVDIKLDYLYSVRCGDLHRVEEFIKEEKFKKAESLLINVTNKIEDAFVERD